MINKIHIDSLYAYWSYDSVYRRLYTEEVVRAYDPAVGFIPVAVAVRRDSSVIIVIS